MSTDYAGGKERRHAAEIFRDNWLWLVLLGAVLIPAGALAILVPAVSEIPASKILGSVLVVSGLVQIMQAAKMLNWIGFIWHMMLGVLATIGGSLDLHGSVRRRGGAHAADRHHLRRSRPDADRLRLRVRSQAGWHWFLVVGFHRADRERALGGEAALQPFFHAGDDRGRVVAVRRLRLRRHRTGLAGRPPPRPDATLGHPA